MRDNQKDNRNQKTGSVSKEKVTVGLEKKKDHPNDLHKKQSTPTKEGHEMEDQDLVSEDFNKLGHDQESAKHQERINGKKEKERDRDARANTNRNEKQLEKSTKL